MKPDPPENVVARPVPSNPRRLEVTWQTPSTWPDPESFPLKFFLRYRPLILDQWQHVSILPCPNPCCLSSTVQRGRGNRAPLPCSTCTNRGPSGSLRGLLGTERDRWAWENGWSQERHPHQNMSLRTPVVVERSAGKGTGLAVFPVQSPPAPALPRRVAVLDAKNRIPLLKDLQMGPRA